MGSNFFYTIYLLSLESNKLCCATHRFALLCGSGRKDQTLDQSDALHAKGALNGRIMFEVLQNFTFQDEAYMGNPPTESKRQCGRKDNLLEGIR